MSNNNKDIVTPAEQEYEEKFKIEISTQKGSSIRVETSSYNKLDDLIDKALNYLHTIDKRRIRTSRTATTISINKI